MTLFKKKDMPPTLATKFSKLVVDKLERENDEKPIVSEAESTNECTTPTGEEYRIPEPLTCPPAPRAKKRKVSPCSSNVDAKEYKEYVALPEIEAVLALNHAPSSKIAWSACKKRR